MHDFVYLGHMITNLENRCFTEWCISRAVGKFYDLKNVLSDKNINMGTGRKLMEACVRSRLWHTNMKVAGHNIWARSTTEREENDNNRLLYRNTDIESIVCSMSLCSFIEKQHLKYLAHICRAHICRSQNTAITKKILFTEPTRPYYRDPWIRIANIVHLSIDQAKASTQSRSDFNGLLHQLYGDDSTSRNTGTGIGLSSKTYYFPYKTKICCIPLIFIFQ